ncbi:hypothetical protein [Paenibacillus sp. 32352]|uniref:hypothetical protein n=1 Tax=Paenibacillus sp. 32352 TaxID=1969111 RepID=UPI0009AC4F23|nr:hypothetical protein [Paenibacillus sp. 32352]
MTYNAKTNWKFEEIVTEHDMNRLEQGIKDAHAEGIDSPEPTALNLRYGTQVVQSDRVAPYNVTGFKGRTLINLLGQDGGFESISRYFAYQSSIALDPTNTTSGMNGLKVTVATGYPLGAGATNSAYQFHAGRKYILIGDVKNGNATGVQIQLTSLVPSGIGVIPPVTDTTKFTTVYKKFSPTEDTQTSGFNAITIGEPGTYGYFDSCRVYEISDEEYNEIDSMTTEQIAARYPYVDDMKSIMNPYVIKYGENLLPPFTEWETGMQGTSSYVIMDPYKISVTSNDSVNGSFIRYYVPVARNQTYYFRVTITGANFKPYYYLCDAYKRRLSNKLTGESINTLNDTIYLEIVLNTLDSSGTGLLGTAIYSNPTLTCGEIPKPFKPREDNYLFFPGQWCSNIDGSVSDQLYRIGHDYYKLAKFRTMDLDGNLHWVYSQKSTGKKQVRIPISGFIPYDSNAQIVKFDGKILTNQLSTAWQTSYPTDAFNLWNDGLLYISISNADSGWGDDFQPSQAEIQAYFNGWKMFDGSSDARKPYTSGTKYWAKIKFINSMNGDAGGTANWTTTTPTFSYPEWSTPYKLQYQLSQPLFEKIIPEGAIMLHDDLNQIEVGTGVIVREKASIPYRGDLGWAYINDSIEPQSALKYRAKKIVYVHKNEQVDKVWTISSTGMKMTPYLGERAYKQIAEYDPSATYTVTYLALDQHSLTSNIQDVQGEYSANLRTNVDTLTKNQADIVKRVSVLENTKAQKVQPQWITSTLLNGWVNYGAPNPPASYYLDDQGIVHLRGSIKDGATNAGVPIFILPKGYRPSHYLRLVTLSNNGTAEVVSSASVEINGEVQFRMGGNNWFILNGISFRAEQ